MLLTNTATSCYRSSHFYLEGSNRSSMQDPITTLPISLSAIVLISHHRSLNTDWMFQHSYTLLAESHDYCPSAGFFNVAPLWVERFVFLFWIYTPENPGHLIYVLAPAKSHINCKNRAAQIDFTSSPLKSTCTGD